MNIERMAGFVCGVLVGIILIMIALKWTRRDKGNKCKFDERQQIVRGRGFKYGFFTMAACNFLYGMVDMVIEKKIMDTFAVLFICVMAGVLVHIGYCIWNEGYFALNEDPKRVCILSVFIALMNLSVFVINVVHEGVIKDGVISFDIVNLVCGIMFLLVFLLMFIRWNLDKREAE